MTTVRNQGSIADSKPSVATKVEIYGGLTGVTRVDTQQPTKGTNPCRAPVGTKAPGPKLSTRLWALAREACTGSRQRAKPTCSPSIRTWSSSRKTLAGIRSAADRRPSRSTMDRVTRSLSRLRCRNHATWARLVAGFCRSQLRGGNLPKA